ncbi:alpha/beta hydrolase [Patulibacter defluvii]|uniref:alpha/beta hydrolase n=1 Tax=Patulibacter defluvii TaxID=3095358 RepID=UPI002A757D21|nr:alpha/beta hydrolase-fold protein [Patulibacter sp. DM4]
MTVRPLVLVALALTLAGCGTAGARSATAAAPGTIVDGSYRSTALRGSVRYRVFLPPGYAHGRRRYPVVYFLHGLPATARSYRNQRVGLIGRAAVRAGRPAIVVGAQGARAGERDPEWLDHGPGRDWESAVADELVPLIDHRFRTIADRRARAIMGLSAGGYGATLIGLHNPQLFSVIQAWSGYFFPTDERGRRIHLGSASADRRADAHTLLADLPAEIRRDGRVTLEFYIGDRDRALLRENRRFADDLRRLEVPHRFAVYPGGHSSRLWNAQQQTWVGRAVRGLLPARAPAPRTANQK